ncbi:PQQ-binding-like beta-propeller repeat protein [Halobellus litoreus]|uniref:PQQ-binding-like beta-propeller repeat protein n=1 Tax=Halobellus litoreus TaxID=755310 RepID=A0ABD6DTW4_9EURY|nr:PQQ-binding-like beta-propeller repeat protein [Halobellus litoreus]
MSEFPMNRRDLLQATGAGVLGTAGLSQVDVAEASSGGDKVWEFEANDVVRGSPTVVGETVFAGSDDENLYAINTADGTKRWSYSTSSSIMAQIRAAPAVVDDTVYFGTDMRGFGRVYAVDATDGSKEWRYKTGARVRTSPTVVDETVFVCNHGGTPNDPSPNLYALDADDGSKIWQFQTNGNIQSSPTVVDGTVYVGSDDSSVYAVSATDGTEQWSTSLSQYMSVRSSPTVVNETVYVGLAERDGDSLYALDAKTGSVQWKVNKGGIDSSPTVIDGTLYIGSFLPGRIYAVDIDDGSSQWTYETNGRRVSSPTVAGDVVYIGSTDGVLYALDRSDGSKLWTYDTETSYLSSPIVSDGTLYVGSGIGRCCEPGDGEGTVYALNAGIDGSSEGSRVSLGTLGHHHTFADREPPEPDDPDAPDPDPDGELTGTVRDVDGRPREGAAVSIYDASGDADAVLARTTADDGEDAGTYAFPDLETDDGKTPDRVLLVAREGKWFGSVEIDGFADQLPLEYDIELDGQLLFGPEIAADGRELSVLTCWRRIIEPRRQTVFVEAVNVAQRGARHEITADATDLTGGAFAATVLADDVWINFGSQSDVEGTVPGSVEVVGLDTSTDNAELGDWHPVRTGVPLYPIGGEVGAAFERISTADADVADRIDEGFGAIAGIIPGVSELLTWLDTVEWAFGERLESEARVGADSVSFPDPNDPSATQTRVDPNDHTTAQLAWRSDNETPGDEEGAVVMAVPLEFQYEKERTTVVTVEAEWTHPNAHASFGGSFEIGPVGGRNGEEG